MSTDPVLSHQEMANTSTGMAFNISILQEEVANMHQDMDSMFLAFCAIITSCEYLFKHICILSKNMNTLWCIKYYIFLSYFKKFLMTEIWLVVVKAEEVLEQPHSEWNTFWKSQLVTSLALWLSNWIFSVVYQINRKEERFCITLCCKYGSS